MQRSGKKEDLEILELLKGSGGCFTAQTQVMMADRSTKSIAEIRAVLESSVAQRGQFGYALQPQTVQQRIVKTNVATNILEFALILGRRWDRNETTAEHPFWLRGVGWVSVGSLLVLVAAEYLFEERL